MDSSQTSSFSVPESAGTAADFRLHSGQIIALGTFSFGGPPEREVQILWSENSASNRIQSGITDEQWEILCLAFRATGKISVLSDQPDPEWTTDLRNLEANLF